MLKKKKKLILRMRLSYRVKQECGADKKRRSVVVIPWALLCLAIVARTTKYSVLFGKAWPLTSFYERQIYNSNTPTVELCWFWLYRFKSQPGTLDVVPIVTVITLHPINKLVLVVRVKTVYRWACIVHEIILVSRIIAPERFPCCFLAG